MELIMDEKSKLLYFSVRVKNFIKKYIIYYMHIKEFKQTRSSHITFYMKNMYPT